MFAMMIEKIGKIKVMGEPQGLGVGNFLRGGALVCRERRGMGEFGINES